MKRLSVALKKRLAAVEAVRNPAPLKPEHCMAVPEMATDVDQWSRLAEMQQIVLRARAANDEPDDSNLPYPDELIEHFKNENWEIHA